MIQQINLQGFPSLAIVVVPVTEALVRKEKENASQDLGASSEVFV